MQLTSLHFAAFFVAVLILLSILKDEHKKNIVLLLASYLFYISWDYRFLVLLVLQTAIAYFFANRMNSDKNRKTNLILGIVLSLCILGFFKYYNFFILAFCDLFKVTSTNTFTLILPIGISFYTFQSLSYLIDVYRGKIKSERSFLKIALFVGFFPQLTSGPIVKAHDFLPQLEVEHHINRQQLAEGAQIFLFGVVKKIVIADRLGVCVNAVYAAPSAYNAGSLICATIAYAIQIYCDFSGYSDMAIGIAHMMGYDLGKNFNAPYIARNPSDFWRRWHISLSSWFKEYVYFPLGGNRKGRYRTYLNLMIVMILSGLWHGTNWTFVVWGVLYGIASVAHKIFTEMQKKYNWYLQNKVAHGIANVVSVIATFAFVTFCWIFFRADSIATAWIILSRIFTWADGINYIYVYTIIYGIIVLAGHLYVALRKDGKAIYPILNLNKFSSWFILWMVIFLTLALFYAGNTAFIYAKF